MTDQVDVKDDDVKDVGEDKQEVKLSPEEQKAISLGWKPKAEWEGPEEDFVPAKHWLKYGDQEQRVIALESELKHTGKVINSMKTYYTRVKEDAKKEVLETIKRQKAIALRNEDFQKIAELDLQANDLESNLDKSFKQVDVQVAEAEKPTGPPPEFFSWNRENSWYKYGNKNDEMTVEADTLAVGYAQRNPDANYKQVLSYVEKNIKKMFPDKFKTAPVINPVDEGGEGVEPTTPKVKAYKLTAAEKAAAQAFGMSEEEYAKGLKEYEVRKGR